MHISRINSSTNFGMAKLDDKLKTRVVTAWVSAKQPERSSMDNYLKDIAAHCKGATIYRCSKGKGTAPDIYAASSPHEDLGIRFCEIPYEYKNDMIKVLQKIAVATRNLDDKITPLEKASMHIDEIMKEG